MRRSGPVRRFVDRKLYVERWLLELKRRLGARGLEAHVRALDGRGGERLGLEVLDAGSELVSRLPPFRPPVRVPMPDLAESTAGAAEVASAAAEAMGRLAEVAGQAVETVSTAGSCLGDASCPGPDCGSVDCGSVDCGGL